VSKVFIGCIVSLLILISFQNCEMPPRTNTAEGNANNAPAQSSAINLADENIQQINFTQNENVTVQKSTKIYTLVSQATYAVNYQTGELTKTSDAGPSELYCLSQSLLNELQGILTSSKVCKAESIPSDDRVCTQALQPAYAQIITNRDQIDLGSASDGCGRNKVDLCETSSSDMLKGWFVAVKNQLPQLSCPQ
jgi:hypothetical protein